MAGKFYQVGRGKHFAQFIEGLRIAVRTKGVEDFGRGHFTRVETEAVVDVGAQNIGQAHDVQLLSFLLSPTLLLLPQGADSFDGHDVRRCGRLHLDASRDGLLAREAQRQQRGRCHQHPEQGAPQ